MIPWFGARDTARRRVIRYLDACMRYAAWARTELLAHANGPGDRDGIATRPMAPPRLVLMENEWAAIRACFHDDALQAAVLAVAARVAGYVQALAAASPTRPGARATLDDLRAMASETLALEQRVRAECEGVSAACRLPWATPRGVPPATVGPPDAPRGGARD